MGISPLIASLLLRRGLRGPAEAEKFLQPRLSDLHDPFQMQDMDRVVERLRRARDGGEKILIYGDYDVDGITSIVVLRRALEMLGAEVEFYLPSRLEEGYGVRGDVLERFHSQGTRLVITVDSGTRDFEAAEAARRLGMDLIVTDHHLPARRLPPAYAILNPRRSDCAYPFKDLAAVGVVFKLVQALFQGSGREPLLRHFLKMVAIGTIGDMVPMRGENRVMVRFGLDGLSDPRNQGLRTLLKSAGVRGQVTLSDVGFKLAPRINAVTRMGGGSEVVDLFSIKDPAEVLTMVEEMNSKNLKRREEEQRIMAEVERQIEEDPAAFKRNFLVVAGQDWHRGVIGIVASRLMERFYRPALVFSVGAEDCQGSGRSIPGFDLVEALDHCAGHLSRFGGHAQAAGCLIQEGDCRERIGALAECLNQQATEKLAPEQLVPSLQIEEYLPPEDISMALHSSIEQLEPFGVGNPAPIFASKGVHVVGGPWVLKERHLKMQVQCNGSRVDAIWWKNGDAADNMASGAQVDLAYTMERDSYLGEDKLLLTIRDIHFS